MLRLSVISFIFCVLRVHGYAQVDRTISFTRMDARDIGSENCTYQCWDKNGGCWLVADKGIIESNGYQSYYYRAAEGNENTVLNDSIHRMFSTGPEEIFISYQTIPYITILNTTTRTFSHHKRDFLLEDNGTLCSVTNIKTDHYGNVYVMSWGNGIEKYDHKTKQFSTYSLALDSDTMDYRARPKEFIQLDGDEYLVCFFNQKRNERQYPIITNVKTGENYALPLKEFSKPGIDTKLSGRYDLSTRIINCAYVDKDKNIWLGSYSGLFFVDMKRKEITRVTNEPGDFRMNVVNVRSMFEVNGELWCGTPNMGIVKVDMSRKTYSYIQSDPFNPITLFNDRIVSVSKDLLGNLWICSEDGMVSVYAPMSDRFKVHGWKEMGTEFSERAHQVIPVNQMLVEENGNVLISSEAGLQRYNPQLKKTVKRMSFAGKKKIKRNVVYNFKLAGDSILVNIDGFMAYYDEKQDEIHKLMPSSSAYKFLFRHSHPHLEPVYFKNNKLLKKQTFFTYNAITQDLDTLYTFPEGLRTKETFTLELSSGRWLIHDSFGRFLIFDREKLSHELYSPSSSEYYFPDSTVRIAHVEGERIFIGTSKGLYEFNEDTKESRLMNQEIGLKENEVISAMVRDRLNRLWIALEKDIVCWNEEKGTLDRYTSKDGLNVGAFLPAIGQIDNKGYLYFATMNGMLVFNPMSFDIPDLPMTVSPLHIAVAGDTLFDRNLSMTEELQFHWNDDDMVFTFYTNQIFQSSPHRFEYRFKGQSKKWTSNGTSNKIRFFDLPHGDYVLQVRATNGYSVTSDPLEIKFTVKTPFWLTWWFYSFAVIFAGALVFYYIKYREKAMRKRQEVLEETVKERTAEVVEQKHEADRQREMVEEKQKEITDSINYAKRIQEAIMPSDDLFKKNLPNSFILYKPKDIVAGDFYWMEEIDNGVIFAAADCTGHGVPGAMVSVVCNNALNRSVREFGLTDPGKILDKTRELVIEQFEKGNGNGDGPSIKDGMDISICHLNKSTNVIKWAGANNPLWLLRNGELEEVKGDKQPIGQYHDPVPFTSHEKELLKDDFLCIFSDGYADQFGGEKGKKFKTKAFKTLLSQVSNGSMEHIKKFIDDSFEEWKGDYEQVDDVCVIGVRV